MKKYIVTSDGVSYIGVKETISEAQSLADNLNEEYYQHKVWNVQECNF